MSGNRFEILDGLTMGDEIRIRFSGGKSITVHGIELESPFNTTVRYVTERRLDEKEGHDVDGIVRRKQIYIEVPDHDELHGEYVIEIERSLTGESKVRPIEAREYFEGSPRDGTYSMHSIGFSDVELLD